MEKKIVEIEGVIDPEAIVGERAKVFEAGVFALEDAYAETDAPDTPAPETTWQQRLYIEHWELTEKLVLLNRFMKTPEYMELHPDDRMDLTRQYAAMSGYREILSYRLSKI